MNVEFHNPHALWLLLLIPAYLYARRRRITTTAVRYPSVRNLQRLPKSFRQRCRILMTALRTTALVLLVIVLARPLRQIETQELPSEGIAIAMLVDRSGSMAAPDNRLKYKDTLALRFDVAKDVLTQFVLGDGKDLKGRPNDLVGLCTFATYPRTDHPFSLDHTSLAGLMERMSAEKPFLDQYGRPTDDIRKAGVQTDEQGRPLRDAFGRTAPRPNPMQYTSLKTAIEYTAQKLLLLDEDLKRPGGRRYDCKSKVMVLLTDGEPTVADARRAPDYPDEETIKQLTDAGIKVYFIQILAHERYRERPDGTVEVIVPQRGGLFSQMQSQQEAAMANEAIEQARRLARRTGGEHFLATSGDELKTVYEKIDEMERSDVGSRTVFSHEERYWWFLAVALALLAGEALLGLTWLRRAP
ncbi:MAG: VWA domain-containing protein [Phycisphaerae bacterium]|nr:VWA domain-containing protein [Phycisphaerae bacterium]